MKTENIIVRGSAGVWLGDWQTKRESAAATIEGIVSGRLPITEPCFMRDRQEGGDGWVKIGSAQIILALTPPDNIAADEIRALQHSLELMRAQHHLAEQALLERISKLQAIGYQPATMEA